MVKQKVGKQVDQDCSNEPHSAESIKIPLLEVKLCQHAAAIFRALGDPSRLQLLALLAKREMCVTELTERLQDNLPAISQRLKLLRSERLVKTRREGKHIYYSLADNHIALLIENGLAHGSEADDSVCSNQETGEN
ncbi:MAG: metalloregulator ArsR/SmtB family transcription factor [Planctomycetaceae bacterium]|nr:metalloregulator ArsR/SmtB family transcription factor [Planctomycetaceae bacterium]MCE2813251.1 metalloregulator ArsR/SmtB family transcription factor [Planctomycetaceae bacterium]